jgi:signal transduction histidine kinase
MASAPSDPGPILGRVDGDGRLVAADPELERLQIEAGSSVGMSIALPQLAAVVRVARRLGIPISRRVLAAGREQDVDMWVRAVPENGEVALAIDRWISRPASGPRLAAVGSAGEEKLLPEPLTWAVDEQLRVISLSAALAELLSGEMADAVGQPLTKLFRLEESEDGGMPLLDALAARQDFSGQRVRVREGGQELELCGSVALDAGSFAGFEGSAVSLNSPSNHSREIDGAIQTALKSPLDKIVQSATEMSQSPESAATGEYSAYAADIATAARHLLSVLRSLGEQSDPAGASEVDLVELTSEVIGLVESAAKERGILIAVQPSERLSAKGESRSTVQILVNLIGNAVRYAPESSAITISFERTSQAALVHVADEGPGIREDDQERIFEPFQKGSDSNEGSGLGLAIARRLARAMSGEIQLQSAPGEGSRFSLALPAA